MWFGMYTSHDVLAGDERTTYTMPTIDVIKASDAPAPPKKLSKVANELMSALSNLKKDEVLKITPDTGKTLRGIKTSVGRITSGANVKVETWDDGTAVYVKKAA